MVSKKGTTIRVDDAFLDFLYCYKRRGMSHQDVLEELLGIEQDLLSGDYDWEDDYYDE